MKNLTPEMIEKAKAAGSAEELLELAKANGVEMTADEAAAYFAQLNPKSGELDDDDLDAVAGGGCESSTGHTVVTSGCSCFTGQFEFILTISREEFSNLGEKDEYYARTDHLGDRKTWFKFASYGCCGSCRHLEFQGKLGVCGRTGN